jgi:hypothetical protein
MSELSDSETQRVLWTDKIDGRTDDLFDLQDRLSEKTITTIAPHVQEAEMRRVLLKRPENFGAYDFMLRGLELLYRLKRNEFDRAREMFEKSIALASLDQAKQFMDENPQEARAILAKYTKLPELVVQKIPFVTYRFWLDPRDFAVWVNVLKDLGQITRSIDENSLVMKVK